MREKIDFSERFLNTYTRITDVHRLKTGRQAGVATKDVFAQNIRLAWTDTSALTQRLV